MEYKISKKLFEYIMSIEDCGRINVKDNFITYNYGHNCISLALFFFKCKDWALELGYELRSWNKTCEILELSRKYYVDVTTAKSHCEIQAVIEACEYILDIQVK